MTKTEQLENLTDVARGLESLGASILSAEFWMDGAPAIHLSQYDLPAEVSQREHGQIRGQEFMEHFYIAWNGVRVFWMTAIVGGAKP